MIEFASACLFALVLFNVLVVIMVDLNRLYLESPADLPALALPLPHLGFACTLGLPESLPLII